MSLVFSSYQEDRSFIETVDNGLPIPGRAVTVAQKQAVINRIYEAWISPKGEHMRLGQLIGNALSRSPDNSDTPDIFYIEDNHIAEAIEDYRSK